QHIGRYHGLAGGRESMRFFEQHENGIWQISLVGRIGYFPLVSCHSSEYGGPQQGPHNDLLLVLICVDELEHGTLRRLEQVSQQIVFAVSNNCTPAMASEAAVQPPFQCIDRGYVARAFACFIAVALLGHFVHQILKSIVAVCPNALAKVIEGFAEKVFHLLRWLVEQVVNVAKLERIESDLYLFRPEYPDFGSVSIAPKV